MNKAQCFLFLAGLLTFGKASASMEFNGLQTSTYTATIAGAPTVSTITFTAWVYPRSFRVFNGIIRLGNKGLLINQAGTAITFIWDSTPDEYNGAGLAIPLNQWTFVAVVIQPTVAVVYASSGSALATWTDINANAALSINGLWYLGGEVSASRTWDGFISDARIYNGTALSVSQLQTLAFSRMYYPMTDGLTAWWKGDNGGFDASAVGANTVLDYGPGKFNASGATAAKFGTRNILTYP